MNTRYTQYSTVKILTYSHNTCTVHQHLVFHCASVHPSLLLSLCSQPYLLSTRLLVPLPSSWQQSAAPALLPSIMFQKRERKRERERERARERCSGEEDQSSSVTTATGEDETNSESLSTPNHSGPPLCVCVCVCVRVCDETERAWNLKCVCTWQRRV